MYISACVIIYHCSSGASLPACVSILFPQTPAGQAHELATVRIDVGVRVLYLSLLQKHWRNGVIASIHQLEQGIVGAMSQRKLSFLSGGGTSQRHCQRASAPCISVSCIEAPAAILCNIVECCLNRRI